MFKYKLAVISVAISIALLSGCGGGGGGGGNGGTTTAETPDYQLSGQFQKGPFAIGSQISVNEQDENINPNGKVYNIQTSDDLGNFSVATKIKSHLVEIIGDGFYMDELTGQLSLSRIQLRAVVNLKVNPTVTVNILTSLQGLRLKKLISQGSTYTAANTQSQNEVLVAFGIDPTKVNGLTTLYSMKINGNTDSDSVLLAISAILSKMATNAAVANGTTQPTELSNYVNTIASQIENNGVITLSSYRTAISLAATQVDLAAVRTNVETYYANRGITIVAPKFQEWVDKDGSGILPRRLVPATGLVFTDVTGVRPGQLITSNVIAVAGLGAGIVAPVTVSTGTTIIKNNVAVTGTSSTAQDGDTIAMRVTSLGYGLTNTSTISVGSTSTVWRVSSQPLSGTIRGLTRTGLVLQNNAGDNITIPAGSTSFSFPTGVAFGGGFNVSVLSQPTNPIQKCSISNGAGTVSSVSTNIIVNCNWTATGSMVRGRFGHNATLLSTGKVLVVGGERGESSAELYDPTTGGWTLTGSLINGMRTYTHTTTLLANGMVLVVGGGGASEIMADAERYDPVTGVWTATGSLITRRARHTATLLPNGKILVAGGGFDPDIHFSAELYDPATGAWSATGSLITRRQLHTATLLPNGKVLIAGGNDGLGSSSSAELYDPVTGLWTATGGLLAAHQGHTATLLPNGKVLVVGGLNGAGAELYDPATGVWTATGNPLALRAYATATLLQNGKILVAGGNISSTSTAIAELYDAATGVWSATGSLITARQLHSATLLSNGKVLVAGDYVSNTAQTELYSE